MPTTKVKIGANQAHRALTTDPLRTAADCQNVTAEQWCSVQAIDESILCHHSLTSYHRTTTPSRDPLYTAGLTAATTNGRIMTNGANSNPGPVPPPPPTQPPPQRRSKRFIEFCKEHQVWAGAGGTIAAAIIAAIITITVNNDSSDDGKIYSPPPSSPATPTSSTTPSGSASNDPTVPMAPSVTLDVPTPVYQISYSGKLFTLTERDGVCPQSKVDLDGNHPTVKTGHDDLAGQDLNYEYDCGAPSDGLGLSGDGKSLGRAALTTNTPESCKSDAETGGAGRLHHDDMKVNDSFCVVTDMDSIVWLTLVKVTPINSIGGPDLSFRATAWSLTSD